MTAARIVSVNTGRVTAGERSPGSAIDKRPAGGVVPVRRLVPGRGAEWDAIAERVLGRAPV